MTASLISTLEIDTPAFIYDAGQIVEKLEIINRLQMKVEFDFIYSIKSANFSELLKLIQPYAQGFSASSLNEANWLKQVFAGQIPIHYVSPGLSDREICSLSDSCNVISFNSWSQFNRLYKSVKKDCRIQIRVNPKTSFPLDDRYNPCRKYSKLGVPLTELKQNLSAEADALELIGGIHIHNNCESRDFNELFSTVKIVVGELGEYMHSFSHINLGGGYLFESENDLDGFIETVNYLKSNFDINVIFEPGKAIVGQAGFLLTSIIDMFESDGLMIAVLDTTVNHLPELFEYQRQASVVSAKKKGKYQYQLSGCSCLSGDILGRYYFDTPLQLGSKVLVENVGAYMFVKANMFNGINLPDVHLMDEQGQCTLIKKHDYDDYCNRLA